jgi:type II secretory pathway component GspD/PulD (secretin)
MTPRTTHLLALALLLATGLAIQAKDQDFVQKVYPVADLVVPVNGTPTSGSYFLAPGSPAQPPTLASGTFEAHLMKLIVESIESQSWSENGGKATIDYFPIGMALVVSQTAEVHEQIAALLESLRKNADKEIGVEIRVVSLSEKMAQQLLDKHQIDCLRQTKNCIGTPQVIYLTDIELYQIIEELQGDRQVDVMWAPKMTLFNGQSASCQVMDSEWLPSNVQVIESGGQVAFVPQNKPVPFGINYLVQPVISGDGKSIRVQLNVNFMQLAGTVEGGVPVQPAANTQRMQAPMVTTWNLDQTVTVPTDKTAVFSGWQIEREVPWGPPVLSKIPYLNRLFSNVREPRYMLVLVTPRVVEEPKAEETAQAVPARPQPIALEAARTMAAPAPAFSSCPAVLQAGWADCGGWAWPTAQQAVQPVKCEAPAAAEADFMGEVRKEMAALLVRKYREACQKGLKAEAKCIAEEALELEPTCFSGFGECK